MNKKKLEMWIVDNINERKELIRDLIKLAEKSRTEKKIKSINEDIRIENAVVLTLERVFEYLEEEKMKKVKDEDILVKKVDTLTAGYLNNIDTINYILDNAVFKDAKKIKEPGKLIKWISYVLTSLLFLVIGLGLVWLIVQIIKHL